MPVVTVVVADLIPKGTQAGALIAAGDIAEQAALIEAPDSIAVLGLATTAISITGTTGTMGTTVTTDIIGITVSSTSIPFYYGYGYGYPYGYAYGYPGYASYYSQPSYYEGDYAGGNYSAEVDVQSALADLGYYDGPIDGIVGSGTRRAVRAFQRDNGLPVTGRIDRRLLNALRAS